MPPTSAYRNPSKKVKYDAPNDYDDYYAPRQMSFDSVAVIRIQEELASLKAEFAALKQLITEIPETIKDLSEQMSEVLNALDEITE